MSDATIPAGNAPDLIGTDGRYLRRGYIELTLTPYYGNDVPEERRDKLALIVGLLHLKRGRTSSADEYTMPTSLDLDIDEATSKKAIKYLADKLTGSYGVSAFTDTLDTYDKELDKFTELASIVTVDFLSKDTAA